MVWPFAQKTRRKRRRRRSSTTQTGATIEVRPQLDTPSEGVVNAGQGPLTQPQQGQSAPRPDLTAPAQTTAALQPPSQPQTARRTPRPPQGAIADTLGIRSDREGSRSGKSRRKRTSSRSRAGVVSRLLTALRTSREEISEPPKPRRRRRRRSAYSRREDMPAETTLISEDAVADRPTQVPEPGDPRFIGPVVPPGFYRRAVERYRRKVTWRRLRYAAMILAMLLPLGAVAADVAMTELCRAPGRVEHASIRQNWHFTWGASLVAVLALTVYVVWRIEDRWLMWITFALLVSWKASSLFYDRVANPICLGLVINEPIESDLAQPMLVFSLLTYVLFGLALYLSAGARRSSRLKRKQRARRASI